jgi:two-component system chemotaxis sensor kinase CheA
MTTDFESLKTAFFSEAAELLTALEAGLLAARAGPLDAEAVNALFRAAHTLKGSAGLFGLNPVVAFAHVVEGLLEKLRAAPATMTEAHRKLLLQGHDELARLVEACGVGQTPEPDAALMAAFGGGEQTHTPRPSTPSGELTRWKLYVKLVSSALRDGMDPLSFLRYLQKLGTVEALQTDFSALPTGAAFDPDESCLAFTLELLTTAPRATIEEVFEFVREGSTLVIDRVPGAAPVKAVPVADADPQLKVSAARLDTLVDLMGELVVASATASVNANRTRDAATIEALVTVDGLISSLRDAALGLRMVPIGDPFARFHRVVRDVSQKLGKEVELAIIGADTELDKAIVEKLFDPLLHIVRNSLDHGLETPEVRRAHGKPSLGTLTLEARHDAGQIVILVRDDGGGLKREKIVSIAVARGLVSADAKLSDAEVVELIFRPGFSSVDQVTDLSGRGVGMDVVRRTVTELRGSVDVESVEGQGTVIRLRLPLTLAIIDGFLVEAGECSWVVPLKQVSECLNLADVLDSEANQRLDVRGEAIPFLRLRDVFGLEGGRPERESVLLVRDGEQRLGLVVDRLVGAWQTVIRPLGKIFRQLEGVGGSTVLGTGEIAFIIDLPRLVQRAAGGTARAAA